MVKKKALAVVLLSGGLDSATTLYFAKAKGFECRALIFDYGQRHRREIGSARSIARSAYVPYTVLAIDLPWKGSALFAKGQPLPAGKTGRFSERIPSTYVPGRNILFLSFAVSYAETIGARSVFIGANAVDYSGYPDCRPSFYRAFREAVKRGTKAGSEGRTILIETPLIRKTKAEIARLAVSLGVPIAKTWSCYRGGSRPCGRCDSCLLRKKGFTEAGLVDPVNS